MKQEEPEVGFQTLKLSAQSSSSANPGPQREAVAMGPIIPKAKPMPERRGGVLIRGTNTYSAYVCNW